MVLHIIPSHFFGRSYGYRLVCVILLYFDSYKYIFNSSTGKNKRLSKGKKGGKKKA